jgi:SAM-dependent methyltransferase
MATASPVEKEKRTEGREPSRADYGEDYFGRPRFRKFLPFLRPGGRVLDLGSHSGVLLNFLEANGFTAVGVDRNPASVARCRGLGFNVLEGDVFAILESPAHAEAYDAVFLSDFVEHFDCREVARLLRSAAGCLRPGGVLAITTPNSRNLTMALGGFYEADLEHVRPYPLSALENELARCGLTTIAAGPEPETFEPLWTWHPARCLRNIARAILARILLGKDWRGANVYLVARKGEGAGGV